METSPKTKLVQPALDQPRRSGLAGAGSTRKPTAAAMEEVPAGFRPLFRTSPFLDLLGPLYCREAAAGLVIGLRIAPKHANARGLIHGGVLMTLCDIAMGYAAAHCEEPPLTLTTAHVSTDFAGSAKVGEWLESRPDIRRIGGRLAFVGVDLTVNSVRIVHASGVYLRHGEASSEGHAAARQSSTRESPPG